MAAHRPRSVLDVATGPAGVALEVEERTGATVIGIDLTEAMLREGVRNVARRGRSDRICFLLGRGEELPFGDAGFDAVVFTYLLRYVSDPAATIAELVRVLAPGGILASIEFAVPPGPVWAPLWWAYTRTLLPLAGGLTGGREWFRVGRFLGPSISRFYARYPLAWQEQVWRDAGMGPVTVRRMSRGGGVVMWAAKDGSR